MKYLILAVSSLILISSALVVNVKLPKPFNKSFKFIPSGLTVVEGDTLSVQSFYMLENEVTNGEYNAFLESIEQENPEAYKEAVIRNNRWSEELDSIFVGPMEELYHMHETYAVYPVVNITHKGAELYCEWLENKINSQMPDNKKVKVRLPKRAEFIRAGSGNNYSFQYSWGNNRLINSEGRFLCNFTYIPYSRMSRGETDELVLKEMKIEADYKYNETFFITRKNSYYPNTYDLHNLNGNVAEWLGDSDNLAAGGSWYDYGYDVRLQSVKTYESASPLVGFRPVITVVSE